MCPLLSVLRCLVHEAIDDDEWGGLPGAERGKLVEVGEVEVSSTGVIKVMWGGGRRTGDGARETLVE